mgnify:CR=1 FL=1
METVVETNKLNHPQKKVIAICFHSHFKWSSFIRIHAVVYEVKIITFNIWQF